MPREPFLPLFVGDFLSATVFWRGEERSLYLLLLAYQWASGPLPGDLGELALSLQYEPKHFQKLWRTVGKKFMRTEGGWFNARLEEHRTRSHEISGMRSAIGSRGGRASAAARAAAKVEANAQAKHQPNGQPIGEANASFLLKQNSTIQSNPNEEEESEASQGKKSEGLQ